MISRYRGRVGEDAAGPPGRPDRLDRRLRTTDAVVIGLGSMIGAGIFASLRPAAQEAGTGLLIGLAIAAVVAYCNATSSAQLAAVYPESGGTYVYGRERLGPFWGYLAGWGFVVGKVASLSAIALTFGSYAWAPATRPLAVAAVVAMTVVNYRGVEKTASVTRGIVALVLAALAAVVVASLFGGAASAAHLDDPLEESVTGILRSAGLLFFAFAGYARIATLGEEVVDPARTIPRAIPLALGLTLLVYGLVAVSALAAVGPVALASAEAPLAVAAGSGSFEWLVPAVRVGGTLASLGVLLSLMAGVSRTAFSMARNHDFPGVLDAVHPRFRTPHRAELSISAVVIVLVSLVDLRGAIGFSSFAILVYYAITNAAAWSQPKVQRRWPRAIQAVGMLGCSLLAFTLPPSSVVGGSIVLAVGIAIRALRRARSRSRTG
jgi:APA family basic amino acid/polyamine antiporter